MSLTSCYRYVLELPVATLNRILIADLQEMEGSGADIFTPKTMPIAGHSAVVDVRLEDVDTTPPVLTLAAADLEILLHMAVRIGVKLEDIPDLDEIIYSAQFDFNGRFETESPAGVPRLVIAFPAVTTASLNLAVAGGQVVLTPALVEPAVHDAYDADPTLAHNIQSPVAWPLGGTVAVTTDIYDDDPTAPNFRGAITVTVTDPTKIVIHMPGHFKVQPVSGPSYINTEMMVDVTVGVVQTDGELRIKLSNVGSVDIGITFTNSTIYDGPAKSVLASRIATKVSQMGPLPDHDIVRALPTSTEIRDAMAARLVEIAGGLRMPVFTPEPPSSPDDIDLTTFVATTVAQAVLALQLEPLNDGTICDTPDVFARTDGFSISIAAVEVNRMMEPVVEGAKGDRTVEGYDMTVDPLTATLSDPGAHGESRGHLWIEGETEVHVDCWFDPTVDFWGPVFLVPEMGTDGRIVFRADAGAFGADDPCCNDVDPAQIASLIEGEQSAPVLLPRSFSGVGELDLGVTEAEIFAAGVVVHGTLGVLTAHALKASGVRRKMLFWANEAAAGG